MIGITNCKIKTKGITIPKGKIVKIVEYPKIWGRDYYDPFCTIEIKGYGLVSVYKYEITILNQGQTGGNYWGRLNE